MEHQQAQLIVIGDQLVLDDPIALAVVRGIGKGNCRKTLDAFADRVQYFAGRMATRGMTYKDTVIVLVNVDAPAGDLLADVLMPGHDWNKYRERGETPFARGVAVREGIQEFLEAFDKEAADKLKAMEEISIVVVDFGVAEIYSIKEIDAYPQHVEIES